MCTVVPVRGGGGEYAADARGSDNGELDVRMRDKREETDHRARRLHAPQVSVFVL